MRFLHLILVRAEGRAAYAGTYQGQRGVTRLRGGVLEDEDREED